VINRLNLKWDNELLTTGFTAMFRSFCSIILRSNIVDHEIMVDLFCTIMKLLWKLGEAMLICSHVTSGKITICVKSVKFVGNFVPVILVWQFTTYAILFY